MAKLDHIIARTKTSSMSIDKICKIKSYLPTRDKVSFLKEYEALIVEHKKDYDGIEAFIGFVFFNLLVIKWYTNIELELTYDEFDLLQENGLVSKIAQYIGDDYNLILSFVQLRNN